MSKPSLFHVAIYAEQSDPAWRASAEQDFKRMHYFPSGEPTQPSFALWAQGAVGESEDEAREEGLRLALETFPVTEGWVNHAATANIISPEMFARIVEA